MINNFDVHLDPIEISLHLHWSMEHLDSNSEIEDWLEDTIQSIIVSMTLMDSHSRLFVLWDSLKYVGTITDVHRHEVWN
jgi:hypothetical protein